RVLVCVGPGQSPGYASVPLAVAGGCDSGYASVPSAAAGVRDSGYEFVVGARREVVGRPTTPQTFICA
nr:hypothetical protein [Gemmatimonadaceae bacterium]